MNPLGEGSFAMLRGSPGSRFCRITAYAALLARDLGIRLTWLEGIKRAGFILLDVQDAVQLGHLQ